MGDSVVDNQVWEETKKFYLENKEQQLAEEIVQLLKARNELDILIYNKRKEYARICEELDMPMENTASMER